MSRKLAHVAVFIALLKVGLFPVLLLASSLAGAQSPDSNWVGTWTLNVANSKLRPPVPRSSTGQTHITASTGDYDETAVFHKE